MPRIAALLTFVVIVGLSLGGAPALSQSTSGAPVPPPVIYTDAELEVQIEGMSAVVDRGVKPDRAASPRPRDASMRQPLEQFRPILILAGLILLPILVAEAVLIVSSRRRGRGDFVSRLARNQPFAVFGIGHVADPSEYRGIRRRGRFYGRRLRVLDFGRKYPLSAPRKGTRIPEVGDLS